MKYEIYLNSNEYWLFDHGTAHMEDGREVPLRSWFRTDTYGRDNVLIDDEEQFKTGRFPLHYLVGDNEIKFYSIDANGPDEVLFHNTGDRPVRIDDYGIVEPGEILEVNLLEK